MTNPNVDNAIEISKIDSIQSLAKPSGAVQASPFSFWWLASAGMSIPSWWSPARDKVLRNFWKKTDYLSGAVYAMESKMSTIPFRVIAKDPSNKDYVMQAEDITNTLYGSADFGQGWETCYGKAIQDLITQDNGMFLEIIGEGDPAGPLTGAPVSVAHLDSSRCQRTGNPTYPVIYHDVDGRMYKLHYTRVMYASLQTSPIAEMYGVGFSSVSRCANVAQSLYDILIFKQEKMGSRPHRKILVTRGGLDPNDLQTAFAMAESEMDSSNLSRYSKIVMTGSSSIADADVKEIDLSSLPDGFNEETSVNLGMATISLAFGVDARELWPATGGGATRADALLQHIKQRGKAPGHIIQITEQLFNMKFLPPHLMMVFDFQDDAQDRQVADTRKVRSDARTSDINNGSISVRIAREQMLSSGDIDRSQFMRMELEDGRLEDGTSVLSLFYSTDKFYYSRLNLGVPNPTEIATKETPPVVSVVDPNTELKNKISEKKIAAQKELINETSQANKLKLMQVIAALDTLYEQINKLNPVPPTPPSNNIPSVRPADPRVRSSNPANPTSKSDLNPHGTHSADTIAPSYDEQVN